MTLTVANYTDALLAQIPEAKSVYDEHLEFYGELINHPFFGDLFQFTRNVYANGEIALFTRIIEFINQLALSTDDKLLNAVHLSFIAHVPYSPIDDAVQPLLNDAACEMYCAILDCEKAS